MDAADRDDRTRTLALAVGFFALAIALLAAHGDPTTAYELSTYASTTPTFWAGVGLSICAGVVVALDDDTPPRLRSAAMALAAGGVLAIVSIPVIRGYFFHGYADSLSHLGWARMMAGEIPGASLSPTELLYPGIHATSVAIAGATGVPLTRAMMLVVVVYTTAYVIFVPLCVARLSRDRMAPVVGTLAGLLLLPINNVSVFNMPYPTGQAIYLLPLLIFLVLAFVRPDAAERRGLRWGTLLALVSLAVLFVHPIVAAPALLALATMAALQSAYRRWRPDHPIAGDRRLHANALLLGGAFVLWAQRFPRVREQQSFLIEGLFFGGQQVADEVTGRTDAFAALGTGIAELYVKLFLVGTVFALLAAFVGLAGLLGRLDDDGAHRVAGIEYLTVGTVPIVGAFLAFFLASLSVLPFRFLGVAMVTATILGAVAIADGLPSAASRFSDGFQSTSSRFSVGLPSISFRTPVGLPSASAFPSRRTVLRAVALLFLGALLMQMAIVHMSPYVYRGSIQVPERAYVGHEVAFEHRDPAIAWAGPRGGPSRYVDAIYGTSANDTTPGGQRFVGLESSVPFDVFGHNVTDHYGSDRYVSYTRANVRIEAGMYEGLRYSRTEYANFETARGIHRVQSNGGFWLYYVNGSG